MKNVFNGLFSKIQVSAVKLNLVIKMYEKRFILEAFSFSGSIFGPKPIKLLFRIMTNSGKFNPD
jgi:hypothetical protein